MFSDMCGCLTPALVNMSLLWQKYNYDFYTRLYEGNRQLEKFHIFHLFKYLVIIFYLLISFNIFLWNCKWHKSLCGPGASCILVI